MTYIHELTRIHSTYHCIPKWTLYIKAFASYRTTHSLIHRDRCHQKNIKNTGFGFSDGTNALKCNNNTSANRTPAPNSNHDNDDDDEYDDDDDDDDDDYDNDDDAVQHLNMRK